MNMLIYITFAALFILSPCSTLLTENLSADTISSKTSNIQTNQKQDLLSILNPLNRPNNYDERDSEDDNEQVNEDLPKITIWEFPTERRTFIGDVEVFITSKEDEENSNEPMDPTNFYILHPHKHRGAHADLDDYESELPMAERKRKRENNVVNDKNTISEVLKQNVNGGLDETINYISRTRRDVREKREMELRVNDETLTGSPKNKYRRMWEFNEYLKWLLNDWDESVPENSENPESDSNQYIENNNKDNTNTDQQNTENESPNNEQSDQNVKILPDKDLPKIQLKPADPELVEFLKVELSDNKFRGKRSIDAESDLNLLTNETDEDIDADGLFEGLLKYLQAGKEFYNMLVTVYFVDK